jgi:hypothetical protein
MAQDDEKQRRNNRRTGWAIGIAAILLYAASIYYGMGQ